MKKSRLLAVALALSFSSVVFANQPISIGGPISTGGIVVQTDSRTQIGTTETGTTLTGTTTRVSTPFSGDVFGGFSWAGATYTAGAFVFLHTIVSNSNDSPSATTSTATTR